MKLTIALFAASSFISYLIALTYIGIAAREFNNSRTTRQSVSTEVHMSVTFA